MHRLLIAVLLSGMLGTALVGGAPDALAGADRKKLLAAREDLVERIEDVLKREAGPSSGMILTVAGAQEIQEDLADLAKDIAAYEKALGSSPDKALTLDQRKVGAVETRAKLWNSSRDFPLMDTPRNAKYAAWLERSSIKGNRILVKRSPTATYRWCILVEKDSRDPNRMKEFVKDLAGKTPAAEWAKEYAKADQAAAKSTGVATGHHVHHNVPLYAGKVNGGLDRAANYVLLSEAKHRATHSRSGETRRDWGPWNLYVTRGGEFEELPEDGSDDL